MTCRTVATTPIAGMKPGTSVHACDRVSRRASENRNGQQARPG